MWTLLRKGAEGMCIRTPKVWRTPNLRMSIVTPAELDEFCKLVLIGLFRYLIAELLCAQYFQLPYLLEGTKDPGKHLNVMREIPYAIRSVRSGSFAARTCEARLRGVKIRSL